MLHEPSPNWLSVYQSRYCRWRERWAIASPQAEPQAQDDHDGAAGLDLLEHDIIPLL